MNTLIVNYHYCMAADEIPHLARSAIRPERFARHMETLATLRARRRQKDWEPFLVTFDDGTKDIFRNAAPLIVRNGIPAILFVCSLPLMKGRLLNVTKNHMLQSKLGVEGFQTRFLAALKGNEEALDMDEPDPAFLARFYRYDNEATRQFKLLLNVRLPPRIVTEILDELFESEFGPQDLAAEKIYMSVEELRECRRMGVLIGQHTHSHTMLSRLTAAEQAFEIGTPIQFFRERLGTVDPVFSYPYGVPGTWNEDTKAILRRFGVDRGFTLGRKTYNPVFDVDPLEIPRFDVNDVFHADGSLALAEAIS